ncbi:AAA family ATPase [Chryseobacterium sp. Marseille-Q3244]|uniref:AAA family ATPase n=1 Tax=Chryseobacterium sp. Marseille-Q3244 TaxID=2758092 RepID=UPI002024479A|nr:AAA family ATPase [Chryseobacterium sp. Marseille-Q3244]
MFRLLKFEIIKHSFFDPQTFNFVNDTNFSDGPYITLLIGPNGTGKSQLLETLARIFNIIQASIENGHKVQNFDCDFNLVYILDQKHVSISSVRNVNTIILDNKEIELISVPTPSKFLASAINLNDRFPFYTNRNKAKNSKYQYLGIRTASNNAFKNNNTLIDRFSNSLTDKSNLHRYKNIFDLLGLKDEITILYKPGKNLSLKSNDDIKCLVNPQLLKSRFQKIIDGISNQTRFQIRKDKYSRVISDFSNLEIISDFFKHRLNYFLADKKSIVYESSIGFNNLPQVGMFLEEVKALKLIRELELLNVEKLILHRKNSKYAFDQASSGEHHILSGFINLISTIQTNSIVFIDEPEISLHPNWQIQYMNLLQKTFADYSNSHFIISTHSHFLVSDLVPDKSSIISFHINDNGEIINETLEFDTYGWSTENILYRVFGVSTVRNHYLEMDLRELLTKISHKSDDFNKMKRILSNLKRFELTPDDPLKKIIQTAEKYLKDNGH